MENSQRYGVPIYGAAWVPTKSLLNNDEKEKKEKEEDEEEDQKTESSKTTTQLTTSSSSSSWLVFCGGGGPGNSGIPNSLLLAQFDSSSNSLSPSPIRIGTGADLPYRMAVHPGGERVVCSFPKSCRCFEWEITRDAETHTLGLKSSENALPQLEDVGQQIAMIYSPDGSALAVGSEDGHLRVFKWPSMEVMLDQADTYSCVKDLSFSSDAKFLVSIGSGGPCRVWDITSSKMIASLPKENDEDFTFCRFSQMGDDKEILYITAKTARGGSISFWDTTSWKKIGSKHIIKDPTSALNVSDDGKLLAIGTSEGDIFIMNVPNMVKRTEVRKAHLGPVTTLMFSEDSRSLVSACLDASARVTLIEDEKESGFSCSFVAGMNIWIILAVVILAGLAYFFLKDKGYITY